MDIMKVNSISDQISMGDTLSNSGTPVRSETNVGRNTGGYGRNI